MPHYKSPAGKKGMAIATACPSREITGGSPRPGLAMFAAPTIGRLVGWGGGGRIAFRATRATAPRRGRGAVLIRLTEPPLPLLQGRLPGFGVAGSQQALEQFGVVQGAWHDRPASWFTNCLIRCAAGAGRIPHAIGSPAAAKRPRFQYRQFSRGYISPRVRGASCGDRESGSGNLQDGFSQGVQLQSDPRHRLAVHPSLQAASRQLGQDAVAQDLVDGARPARVVRGRAGDLPQDFRCGFPIGLMLLLQAAGRSVELELHDAFQIGETPAATEDARKRARIIDILLSKCGQLRSDKAKTVTSEAGTCRPHPGVILFRLGEDMRTGCLRPG